jgi:uncharacterized membrane protein
MNWAYVHLVLNHFPVVGTVLGLLLLLWALARRSEELKGGACGLFVLAGLLALPTYWTGEPAEDRVKGLPGVAQALIEEHEEAAMFAVIASAVLGAMALTALALARLRGRIPRSLTGAILVLAVLTTAIMVRTASLGGRIHHEEIRADTGRASLSWAATVTWSRIEQLSTQVVGVSPSGAPTGGIDDHPPAACHGAHRHGRRPALTARIGAGPWRGRGPIGKGEGAGSGNRPSLS